MINSNNANDFIGIGDISKWFIGAGAKPLSGCIVNVNTPQLENTLSTAQLLGGGASPYFYRPLPGSLVVNAGTATALHTIVTAEIAAGELLPGAPNNAALDETLVNPRTIDSGNIIDMGAVQFSVADSTLNVSFLPRPGIAVPFGTSSVGVEVLVSQGTNPGSLPVNGGTASFNLQQGKSVIGTFTANVSSIGLASASLSLPILLPAGSYTITASYANSNAGPANPQGAFSVTATATLTIGLAPTPPSSPLPIPAAVAALELAIDIAALLDRSNPDALSQLQLISNLFLHYQLPTAASDLLAAIQALYPQTDNMGLASTQFGMQIAQDL